MKDWTFTTPNSLAISARIPAGTMELRTEATTETRVEVEGDGVDDLRVDLETAGGGHRLDLHVDRRKVLGWSHDRTLSIVVIAPEGADVSFESGSADLRCSGPVGAVSFRSGSGDLTFDEAHGSVTMKVASGQLRGGSVLGDVRAHSASGNVRLGDIAGSFVGHTVSGDLTTGAVDGAIQVSGVSGRVEVGAVGGGNVTVRSVSGDIQVGVARGTRVWLDLRSTSGETVSELEASDGAESGSALELHVTTVSGDIRIHRERELHSVDA